MTVGRTAAVVARLAAITKLRRIGWRFGARLAVMRGLLIRKQKRLAVAQRQTLCDYIKFELAHGNTLK